VEYPEQEARLNMLRLLHSLREEAGARGEATHGKLWLAYYPDSARLTEFETSLDIATQLGIRADEAYGRMRDLARDGCVSLSFDSAGPDSGGMVGVSFTEKGRAAIQNLSDPQAELLAALDAIAAAIEALQLQDVDPTEKDGALEAANRLRRFFDDMPAGIAVEVLSRLATVLGVPGG
jgi:hypothetical protein